jgi:hypothetical protein
LRCFPGGADLTENLAFAENNRVKTSSNLEQVRHCCGVVLAVKVRRKFIDRQVADLAKKVTDIAVGAMEKLCDNVNLGAVTR